MKIFRSRGRQEKGSMKKACIYMTQIIIMLSQYIHKNVKMKKVVNMPCQINRGEYLLIICT